MLLDGLQDLSGSPGIRLVWGAYIWQTILFQTYATHPLLLDNLHFEDFVKHFYSRSRKQGPTFFSHDWSQHVKIVKNDVFGAPCASAMTGDWPNSLKIRSKIHTQRFIRSSKIFVWGAYIWATSHRKEHKNTRPPSSDQTTYALQTKILEAWTERYVCVFERIFHDVSHKSS